MHFFLFTVHVVANKFMPESIFSFSLKWMHEIVAHSVFSPQSNVIPHHHKIMYVGLFVGQNGFTG